MAAHTALDDVDTDGVFRRSPSGYWSIVQPGGTFPPEPNRYHLYVSLACPWASGCLAVLFMKGLDAVISHSVTHPTWLPTRPDDADDGHCGWHFRRPGDSPVRPRSGRSPIACDDALVPDPVYNARTLRDVYEKAGDTYGKYSTPVLLDMRSGLIVSNESRIILWTLNFCFNDFAINSGVNLYPDNLFEETMHLDSIIYPCINDGVYRCGFATTQEAYDQACERLFDALDHCEALLQQRCFLTGDRVTWVDVRLFMTLVRFDPVYSVYFKCNRRLIREYHGLSRFLRSMHSLPHMWRAVNMEHIKTHYFTSHPTLNTHGIIACGL